MASLKHLSISSIEKYLDCPMKWRASYVDKVAEEPSARTLPMLFGSAFHKGLEAWGEDQQAMQTAFREKWHELVKTLPGSFWERMVEAGERSPAGYEQLGYQLIREFLALPIKSKPVAREQKFVVKLPGVPVPLLGYIDAIVEVEGKRRILDFKTTGDRWTQHKMDWSLQPAGYRYAVKETYGEDLEFFYVFFCTKQGLSDGRRIKFGQASPVPHAEARFLTLAKKVYEQIRDDDFYPTCPAWQGPCDRASYCERWCGGELIQVAS
jgi:hypothetical protein